MYLFYNLVNIKLIDKYVCTYVNKYLRSVGVVTILPDGSLMLSKLLQGHVSRVRALDCHRDRVLSGSDDRTVKLWSLNSGKMKYIF